MTREQLEHWALERLSGGTGLYPLPKNESADAVWIGFPLEDPGRPVAIFKKNGQTVEVVEFEVRIIPADQRTDYTGEPGRGASP